MSGKLIIHVSDMSDEMLDAAKAVSCNHSARSSTISDFDL